MTIILSVVMFLLAAAALSLKVLLGKDQEVRRPGCAALAMIDEDGVACSVCGAQPVAGGRSIECRESSTAS